MNERRIYLMRHGETLYQSQPDEGAVGGGALTERGQEQIRALALLFKGIPLDRIYASPLRRARETAEILAQEKGMDVLLTPDLREISPSETRLRGKKIGEIFREVANFFKNPHTTWDEPYLGGESFRQVQERALRFIHSLLQQNGWETALLVAHGGVNNAIIAQATGVTNGRIFNVEQDFGCVNIIDYVHGRPLLRLLNFTLYDQLKAHLRIHSLDVILNLLKERGVIKEET